MKALLISAALTDYVSYLHLYEGSFFLRRMNTLGKNLRTGISIWDAQRNPPVPHKKLTRDRTCDVCIVGAGITGALAAEELSAEGLKVIVIDRREKPMKGATSATTALLQYDIDQPMVKLRQQIGHESTVRAWRRSKLAIDSLRAKIVALGIKCDLCDLDSLYLAGDLLDEDGLREEQQWRTLAGLYTDYVEGRTLRADFTLKAKAALRSYGNLSVDPLKMTAGFLAHAVARRAEIFSPVEATAVETHRDGVTVLTQDGPSISAKSLIYATGYEVPKAVKSKRHEIFSTYAIATRPQKRNLWNEQSLIWEASDPYLYVRATRDGRVICGGEDEEFADEEKRDALLPAKTKKLEQKLKKLLPNLDTKAEYAWCGSFGSSKTGLPHIGPVPGMSHTYCILAFGGNGITFSRIAAELLRTTLTGRIDPDADLYTFD